MAGRPPPPGRRRLRAAAPDRPRGDDARAGRGGLRPGAGAELGRRPARRARAGDAAGARRLHRPRRRAADRAGGAGGPPGRRASTRMARELVAALAGARDRGGRRGRLLADARPAARDPGRDPADRRPRRRRRDDGGVRMRGRGRARAALRGPVRGGQPRQRGGRDRAHAGGDRRQPRRQRGIGCGRRSRRSCRAWNNSRHVLRSRSNQLSAATPRTFFLLPRPGVRGVAHYQVSTKRLAARASVCAVAAAKRRREQARASPPGR